MDPFVLVRKLFLIGNGYFQDSDTQPSAYQHNENLQIENRERKAKQNKMHLSTIDIRKEYIQQINSTEIEVGAEFAQKCPDISSQNHQPTIFEF